MMLILMDSQKDPKQFLFQQLVVTAFTVMNDAAVFRMNLVHLTTLLLHLSLPPYVFTEKCCRFFCVDVPMILNVCYVTAYVSVWWSSALIAWANGIEVHYAVVCFPCMSSWTWATTSRHATAAVSHTIPSDMFIYVLKRRAMYVGW